MDPRPSEEAEQTMQILRPLAGLALMASLAACVPAAIVGSGAILTTSVLEERTTRAALDDTAIKTGILHRLGNRSGDLYRDVFVDVKEGRVLLAGTVPRPEDRVAATEAAWAVDGVVAVEDALEVSRDSGTRAYLEDVAISNEVRYALLVAPGVQSVNYSVTTIDRVVHLTGLALSDRELERAVEAARRVGGVKRVVSHVLRIDDPRRRVSRSAKG